MKLTVARGELHLPEDFSFEIEQNSAFFSEDGTSSVPVTIPATPSDLAKVGHPQRIARNTRYVNLFPATLSKGVFRKQGNLVVSSVSKEGISCSIALEESAFYSDHKEKNLKDLFSAKVLTGYSAPDDWYEWIWKIYTGGIDNEFRVIPVAVNKSGDTYQVNNAPITPKSVSNDGTVYPLEHEARIVMEGDDKVSVPSGYGIAPFYRLYAFIEDMFALCGYSVEKNCFRTNADLSSLILLHNCSDVLCNGRIDCSDLAPDKTISEFLEWMRKKFLAQTIVHPATATVDIVLLEDILAASYDKDLTGKLIGNLTVSFSQTSRVVLAPDVSLEGAAPAADTMEDLKKKYGHVKELSRSEAWTEMGLVLDLATGNYIEYLADFIKYNPRSADNVSRKKVVGTNIFRYDRRNSKEEEEMEWSDLTPPMVFVNGYLMPYIGDRKHRNTSYNDSQKDEDQEIIIVEYAGLSAPMDPVTSASANGTRVSYTVDGHYYYGTTQKYDNAGEPRSGRYNLNGPEIYERFFTRYNKMLRNNLAKVEGQFDIPVEDLLAWQMYSLKLYHGQELLPVAMSYEVGRRVRCLKASFFQVKDYADSEEDTPTTVPAPEYTWKLNDSEVQAALATYKAQYPSYTLRAVYNDSYSTGEDTFFLPAPLSASDKSSFIHRTVDIQYRSGVRDIVWVDLGSEDVVVWFEAEAL